MSAPIDFNEDLTPEEAKEWVASFETPVTPFVLRRKVDVSGISGTGIVADGVIFGDLKTVTRWRGGPSGVAQTCVWDSPDHVMKVHGHNGATEIEIVPLGELMRALTAALAVAKLDTQADDEIAAERRRGWNEAIEQVQDEICSTLSFAWHTYGPGAKALS
jgi:hypothetical protein